MQSFGLNRRLIMPSLEANAPRVPAARVAAIRAFVAAAIAVVLGMRPYASPDRCDVDTTPWSGVSCVMQSAVAPFAVYVAPNLALGEPRQRALVAASALAAILVLAAGIRAHRATIVTLPVLAGFALWITAALPPSTGTGLGSQVPVALGGALVATGLFWSALLRHRATFRSAGWLSLDDVHRPRVDANDAVSAFPRGR